jgi:mannose-6-phosphate isomerase
MLDSCLTFSPIYQPRIWGGRELARIFQRTLPGSGPIGESWELVDRPEAQSVINAGPLAGVTVHELWLSRREEVFGPGFEQPRFPLLFKILDAADVLSVQVHPPPEVAERLGGEPKTEIWYFAETAPGAGIYAGFRNGVKPEAFREALENGTVASLLHRIPTGPDLYILIPSGRLHAIGAGNILFEIQQNSDTTYRVFDWNRTGPDGQRRALHLKESLLSIDFHDFEPKLAQVRGELLAACEHFRVECWDLTDARSANEAKAFAVFQCVRGRVQVGDRTFASGDLFFAPASAWELVLRPLEHAARLLRTTLPSAPSHI